MDIKDKRQVRVKRKAALYRAVVQVWQYANRLRNKKVEDIEKAAGGQGGTLDADAQRQAIIDKMTNWQRTQYTKQKVRGQDMPLEQIQHIVNMPRRRIKT